MAAAQSLSLNGVSDSPPIPQVLYFDKGTEGLGQPQVLPLPNKQMDTTNDGYGWNLGTLFKGWELYNDTKATEVPSPQATVAGEKSGPNYLLIGVAAIAAILLLRR